MGAASGIMVAKEDAVFPDSGAYGGWPTSSVELCLEKYLSLREHKDVDMDGTIRDGEMLMVRHVEAGSPASDAKVEADWLLSTVCGKIPKSASMMIFQALGAKNKMSVPTAEVSDVVALFTATLRHMRYLRQPLTDDALGALTESLASHAKNGRLDSEGFVEWGKRESKGGLLAALARSATGTLGKYRKPANKLGVAIATADATHNNSAKYDLEKVDFGYEDLHNLRLEFADASDRSGRTGPTSPATGSRTCCSRFRRSNGRVLTDMLRVFDVNSNNKIYFPEFARALSKLVGSFEEQMSFIFALCDKDADGQLELWELSDLISDASDDMNELGDHIKARIPTFDDGGGFVEMVEFEALLKSDAHLYLNFYWTWVPFIGGNLLAGLELFEQVAIAVGVLPNFELALRMCPAFSAAAGLATAGDWKIGALELAQVLFGALGVPVPAGESFRALQPSEGDGVPAKDDGETPRAAEKVGAADGAETPSMAPTKSKDMHFFATPVLTGAQTAPLMFKLSKAVTLIFDELLGAYKRRAAHAAKANPKPGEVDQFGAPLLPIESEGMDEIPAARVWATVAHYLAARGAAGLTKSANLDVLSPSGMDFDEQVATSPSGATAAIEDDYHPDPIVSPSSRSLKNPPQLPKIPMAKIFTFTNEVCAIHDLMIGTGNRKTKGLIEYDAARVAEYDQVAHPEHPLPVLK
ncbi:hypothetical protein JL720_11945 [Aureococcus anophagefferens]|nr:hypothetical protein JL720_11945 [Aureococcus anophagefferens]